MEVEEGSAVGMSKKIIDMAAQIDRLNQQLIKAKSEDEKMKEKFERVKDKYKTVKERFDSEESKWRVEEEVIREEYRQLAADKSKLHIDLKEAWRRIEDRGDFNRAMEAAKVKAEEKIEVLEKEKRDKDAEICKLKMDMITPKRMSLLQWGRKGRRLMAGGNVGIRKKRVGSINGVAEAEKKAMEDEHKKEVLKLIQEIRANEEVIKRISNEKKAMEGESEKIVSEQARRIEVLEAEARQAKRADWEEKYDKTEEIKRILNDKFVSRVYMLEKEKKEEEKNSKLIQELEREKGQMVAQVLKLQKEKSEEVEKSFSAMKALEAEKKRAEEVEGKRCELVKRNEVITDVA